MKDVTSTQGFERKDKMHFWEKLNKQKQSSSFTSNSKMVLSMNMSYELFPLDMFLATKALPISFGLCMLQSIYKMKIAISCDIVI